MGTLESVGVSLLGFSVLVLLGLWLSKRQSSESVTKSVDALKIESVAEQLDFLNQQIGQLRMERAQQTTAFNSALDHIFELNQRLTSTTERLSAALASPTSRGQWGERLAEDVLHAAGFIEGVNFHKQKKLANGSVPDFSFLLPKSQELAMDVKFPIDNYVNSLESESELESRRYLKRFRADVRKRISELDDRGYIEPGRTLNHVLLFVPNEGIYAAMHSIDPTIIDFALSKRVVLCSPMSLFAMLAVIRQGVDNFMFASRTHELLIAVENLAADWERMSEPILKMGRGIESARRAYLDLTETHLENFAKQLDDLNPKQTSAEAQASTEG